MSDRRSELVDRLRPGLVPVPGVPQTGICTRCHSGIGEQYTYCHQCLDHQHLDGLTPISMSIHNQLLHVALWRYKNAPNDDTRKMLTLRLAALVSTFVEHHARCLGEWDLVTAVPSMSRCAPKAICDRVSALNERYTQVLVRDPEQGRFEVDSAVRGQAVLVFDDTFTSGTTLDLACAALVDAGARIVGPLVVGRHVNPDWAPSTQMLEWLAKRPWTVGACCHCGGESKTPGTIW